MANAVAFLLLLLAGLVATSTSTMLTLHNLCSYPIWPLITPNDRYNPFTGNTGRLDGNGHGLVSYRFPQSRWEGRLVARTGCSGVAASQCDSGAAPPFSVVQLNVHGENGLAEYSLSLVDGFNVPMVISPHAIGSGPCPALGCTVDLNIGCPLTQRVRNSRGQVVACRGPASYFKEQCPYTRTTATDVEPVPQNCRSPGELKIVFCQAARVSAGAAEAEVIRTVVADN